MEESGRRKFINTLLSIGGIGFVVSAVYPIIEYLIPPKRNESNISSLKAGKIDEFEKNSYKILKYGRKPVILIRDENATFHALAATCTHLDCIVSYSSNKKIVLCACHNGVYDLKGRNVSGPPPKPLEEFKVTIKDQEVIISSLE